MTFHCRWCAAKVWLKQFWQNAFSKPFASGLQYQPLSDKLNIMVTCCEGHHASHILFTAVDMPSGINTRNRVVLYRGQRKEIT